MIWKMIVLLFLIFVTSFLIGLVYAARCRTPIKRKQYGYSDFDFDATWRKNEKILGRPERKSAVDGKSSEEDFAEETKDI